MQLLYYHRKMQTRFYIFTLFGIDNIESPPTKNYHQLRTIALFPLFRIQSLGLSYYFKSSRAFLIFPFFGSIPRLVFNPERANFKVN